MQSILHKLSKAQIIEEPFPHIVVQPALDAERYETLAQELGDVATLAGEKPWSGEGVQATIARDILSHDRTSPTWRAFTESHVSPHFYRDVIALFGDHIRHLHPDLEARLGKPLEGLETTIRAQDEDGDIALESQIICSAPSSRPQTIRGPHLDRAIALYAGLLYFRLPNDESLGGDLELYRYISDHRYVCESRQVPEQYAERVKTIPYQSNTLVLFPHSAVSVHAVSIRAATPFPRLHVNLVGQLQLPVYDVSQHHVVIPDTC